MIIKQEKSDEELIKKGDEIIDSLKGLNPLEKYKVIKILYFTLIDVLKEEGIIIEKDNEI